jgi:hypothetical protein
VQFVPDPSRVGELWTCEIFQVQIGISFGPNVSRGLGGGWENSALYRSLSPPLGAPSEPENSPDRLLFSRKRRPRNN